MTAVLPATLLKLDTRQAAEYAHRHPVTIQQAAASGELHGTQRKARGKWLFDRECLDAYLAGRVCPHAEEATHP